MYRLYKHLQFHFYELVISFQCICLQIKKDDFNNFDWIFGMDEDNMDELERKKPQGSKATIELLGKHDPQGELIIRDPYYVSIRIDDFFGIVY